MFSVPMYEKIAPKFSYAWATTLLAFVAILVVIPIYIFYWKGETIRMNSKFSLEIIEQRREIRERLAYSRKNSLANPQDVKKN